MEVLQTNKKENPWIGLQSYSEGRVLFGRDEEIEALSTQIQYNLATVLYGKSGIGKTSLIEAGVFPNLRKQNILPVFVRLEHNTERPYIEQIKGQIFSCCNKHKIKVTETISACNRPNNTPESLWGFFHRVQYKNNNGDDIELAVVFDQFEEIFTIEKDRNKVELFFADLADLLNCIQPSDLKQKERESLQENNKESAYNSESNFHIIISIREDYLFYLEQESVYIPSIKNNRYHLLPLNEEQASEVILSPQPDLIDVDTAKLIIEKVTGENNFSIDGNPEISVDSAMLSLYLYQLYQEIPVGTNRITKELVEESGDNIFEKYYSQCIEGYSQKTIEYLEDKLINPEGFRVHIPTTTAIREGDLTEEQLNILITKKRLLHEFPFERVKYIEFVHDQLIPIIKKRKESRDNEYKIKNQDEQLKKQKEQIENQAKEIKKQSGRINSLKKRNHYILLSVLCIFAIAFSALMVTKPWLKQDLHQKQFLVRFNESQDVKSDNAFWRANLFIIGIYKDFDDDTLFTQKVTDEYSDSTLYFWVDSTKTRSLKKIRLIFVFNGHTSFQDINTIINVADLINNEIPVTVEYSKPNRINYFGEIAASINGYEANIQNAQIIIRDKSVKSNDDGLFVYQTDDSIRSDEIIYVVKEGYNVKVLDGSILNNNKGVKIVLEARENLATVFERRCFVMDSLLYDPNTKWEYGYETYLKRDGYKVKTNEGKTGQDILYIVARSLSSKELHRGKNNNRDTIQIEGFYYLKSNHKKFPADKKYYAYHIFSGTMDRKADSAHCRNFKVECHDIFNNKQTIVGYYIDNIGLCGELRNQSGRIMSFGKYDEINSLK